MDTVTHAIIGAVTARAIKVRHEKSKDHRLLMIAALAAAFPDIDYLLFWVDPYRFITEWHRGATHSLILLPAWAALLSAAASFVLKRRIPFKILFVYCSVGLLTHLAADLITLYGLKIFAPLSHRRYALLLTFDMDPWIGLIALLALLLGLKNRRHAVIGLIAICAYLVLMLFFHRSALTLIDARTKNSRTAIDKVYVLPQPFIPFHWKLIIDRPFGYETADLSLFEKATRLMDELLTKNRLSMTALSLARRQGNNHNPLQTIRNRLPDSDIGNFRAAGQLQWRKISKHGDNRKEIETALEVWRHDSFAEFRRFASLPILYRIDNDSVSMCIWYTDLRYVFPFMMPPFRYGMCRRHSTHDWQLYRLRRNTENSRQSIR
ncbi:MAG: metal-dependent hydrolase [Gammaproteobacteria bacterium]